MLLQELETGLPCCVFGALYKLEPIFSLSSETKLKSMNCILQECELRVHRTITILRTHDVRFFRVLLFAFSILNFNNCPIFSVKIMVHSMTLIYSTINLVSWHCYLLLPWLLHIYYDGFWVTGIWNTKYISLLFSAHMAVFLHYLISNSDPTSVVGISNHYIGFA